MKKPQFSPENETSGIGTDHMAGSRTEAKPVGEVIRNAAIIEIADWIKEHAGDEPDVYQAKLDTFHQVQEIIANPYVKKAHGLLEPIVKVEGRVMQGVDRTKDFAWGIVRGAIATEVPLVRLIPDHPFERMDMLAVQAGGKVQEAQAHMSNLESMMLEAVWGQIRHSAAGAIDWMKGRLGSPQPQSA